MSAVIQRARRQAGGAALPVGRPAVRRQRHRRSGPARRPRRRPRRPGRAGRSAQPVAASTTSSSRNATHSASARPPADVAGRGRPAPAAAQTARAPVSRPPVGQRRAAAGRRAGRRRRRPRRPAVRADCGRRAPAACRGDGRPTVGIDRRRRHVRRLRSPTSRHARRSPHHERADRQQVDRRRAEALERVARVVDHRPPGGVEAGVDHHRQAGAPLERPRASGPRSGSSAGSTVWIRAVPSTWTTAGIRSRHAGGDVVHEEHVRDWASGPG